MTEKFLLIDEIAHQLGLTKRTIRYYEEQGLLKPAARTEKGYRLYSEEDVSRLETIKEFRDCMGFSLKDIKEILQVGDTWQETGKAFKSAQKLTVKKAALEKLREELKSFLVMISEKKAHIQKIEDSYQEKLTKLERAIKELE